MSDSVADGVIRNQLPDDALLVFVSDTHIGGAAGSHIFMSAAELTLLLEDLNRHNGPVELVLAGDFLDMLRMEDADSNGDRVATTITRPEYQKLFGTLRAFAEVPGHRVVYVVGNHDVEVWWNPRIQRSLREAGLVDVFGLSYAASFQSLPKQLVYCEHGNQFDPANTIVDYANPLDTPVGAHVVTELVRPIGSGAAITRSIDLRDVSHVFPWPRSPSGSPAGSSTSSSARCSAGCSPPSSLPTSPTRGWLPSCRPSGGRWRCGPCSSSWRTSWACCSSRSRVCF
jgi:hypothetical protein